MVNKQKQKGTTWERDLVDILQDNLEGVFKRVPGSGALGTSLGESRLTGDIVAKVSGYPKELRIECKVGYGGAEQLTVQRKWLNKIGEEAKNSYAIPILAAKFSGARSGVKHIVVLDLDIFMEIMNEFTKLQS